MSNTIAELIYLRKSRNLNQEELGTKMGYSRGEVSVIERGKRPLDFARIASIVCALSHKGIDGKGKELNFTERARLLEAVISDFLNELENTKNVTDIIHFSKISSSKGNNIEITINSEKGGVHPIPIKTVDNTPKFFRQNYPSLFTKILGMEKAELDALNTLLESVELFSIMKTLTTLPNEKQEFIRKMVQEI